MHIAKQHWSWQSLRSICEMDDTAGPQCVFHRSHYIFTGSTLLACPGCEFNWCITIFYYFFWILRSLQEETDATFFVRGEGGGGRGRRTRCIVAKCANGEWRRNRAPFLKSYASVGSTSFQWAELRCNSPFETTCIPRVAYKLFKAEKNNGRCSGQLYTPVLFFVFPLFTRQLNLKLEGLTLFPYIIYIYKISEMDSVHIYQTASLIQLHIIAPKPAGLPKHCYLQHYD